MDKKQPLKKRPDGAISRKNVRGKIVEVTIRAVHYALCVSLEQPTFIGMNTLLPYYYFKILEKVLDLSNLTDKLSQRNWSFWLKNSVSRPEILHYQTWSEVTPCSQFWNFSFDLWVILYALCAALQGRANFVMDDPESSFVQRCDLSLMAWYFMEDFPKIPGVLWFDLESHFSWEFPQAHFVDPYRR